MMVVEYLTSDAGSDMKSPDNSLLTLARSPDGTLSSNYGLSALFSWAHRTNQTPSEQHTWKVFVSHVRIHRLSPTEISFQAAKYSSC